MSEKILAAHVGKDVQAGDLVVANVDFVLGHDSSSPLAISAFERAGKKSVFDPSKVAFIIDHSAPSPSVEVSSLHKLIREFAEKKGTILYDIGEGICHNLVTEKEHVVPGDLVVGADASVCTYGALNAFSTGSARLIALR